MPPPVPLREGREVSSDVCKFEAAVAAGGIREFFGEEASASSRMRNRLIARRDWDIFFLGLVVSSDLQPTITTTTDARREAATSANKPPSRAKNSRIAYVRVALAPHDVDLSNIQLYFKQHEKASDDIIS